MIGLARLALPVVLAIAGLARHDATADSAPPPTATPQQSAGAAQSPVDSALSDLRADRPWHAARLLRTAYPDLSALDQTGRLVLARAEAGSRDWEGVRRALEGASWL